MAESTNPGRPRIFNALQYIDELVEGMQAVAAYMTHRDESQFADDLSSIVLDVARQLHLDSAIDEEKLRQGLCTMIDALEPVLRKATPPPPGP